MLTQQRQFGSCVAAVLPMLREAGRRRVILALGGVAVALVCVAKAAEPQPQLASEPIEFQIPAQPLEDALHAFGRRVGIQVLYESRSATGRQSEPVQGQFTPDEALRRLLAGTDLEVRHARSDAITLAPPAPVGQELPPTNPLETADLSIGELRVRSASKPNDMARFQDYSESVRAEIQRALQKNIKTGSGNYRAVLDVWIDPSRTIQKAALLQSTGDSDRDAAIAATLQGLMLNRPTPPDAPQPVRAAIVVRTAR